MLSQETLPSCVDSDAREFSRGITCAHSRSGRIRRRDEQYVWHRKHSQNSTRMPAIGNNGKVASWLKDNVRLTVSVSVVYRIFFRLRTFNTSPYKVSFHRSKLNALFTRTSSLLSARAGLIPLIAQRYTIRPHVQETYHGEAASITILRTEIQCGLESVRGVQIGCVTLVEIAVKTQVGGCIPISSDSITV